MSKLTIYPLTYTDDLIAYYQSYNDLPGFVLLESSDINRGRYDILTACPYDQLKVFRNSPDVKNAFTRLKQMLTISSSTSELPFQGGAIGYIAYDLSAELMGIKSPSPHPLLADMPLINMQFYDWAIVSDHYTKQVNLIVANNRSETALFMDEIIARWKKQERETSFKLLHPFTPLISKQEYKEAFFAIHQDLRQGRAYQVNYTQPFLAKYQGLSWEMYKRVRSKNPVPFSAFIHFSEAEILSFSPERFLLMDNQSLLASPIKGSARRSHDPEKDKQLRIDLESSSKNRAENIMIVDLLRNDLGKIAVPGSVRVKSLCELQSFNAVHHLVSDIEAQCLEKISPVEAFASCFPGGSITGAPKRESMHIISEHESFSRGIYCGNIGYFSNHGRFDTNIAIRTVTAKNDTLYLAAGGGIVIDSIWEDEYRECYTKIEAIVNGL